MAWDGPSGWRVENGQLGWLGAWEPAALVFAVKTRDYILAPCECWRGCLAGWNSHSRLSMVFGCSRSFKRCNVVEQHPNGLSQLRAFMYLDVFALNTNHRHGQMLCIRTCCAGFRAQSARLPQSNSFAAPCEHAPLSHMTQIWHS